MGGGGLLGVLGCGEECVGVGMVILCGRFCYVG